jgi:predicted dehydrogenase
MRQVRWGILGTANIAKKNWKAIRLSGNGRVAAVASRSLSSGSSFVDQCQQECPFETRPDPLGSYAELLQRDDVDAVYIPLPTVMRKEWVLRAAAAKKHVLCEKPVGVTASDVREMIDACNEHRVQFMDGVMFMHGHRLQLLRKQLDDAQGLGPIRRITSTFAFLADDSFRKHNIRAMHSLEPHGCLGDLGWYNIRFTLWALGEQLPIEVSARTHQSFRGEGSPESVPAELSANLQFADGVSASFYCSFVTNIQQTAVITCERGYLTLDDFVLPFFGSDAAIGRHHHALDVIGCRWNMQRIDEAKVSREYACGEANAQETNMVRKFADLVASGHIDPYWHRTTLLTQRVLDACAQSAKQNGATVRIANDN